MRGKSHKSFAIGSQKTMAEASTVNGTERAAILLLTLGEQTAASVLRHMDVQEVQRVGSAMATTAIGIGTGDYLRKVLNDSLGERKAGNLLGRILKGRDSTGIDALKWMDPRTVAEVIKS